MAGRVEEFEEFRSRMNARILELDNRSIKRFFGVDTLIDGYVVLTCSDPSVAWYGYGSVVDWTTHDAVYHAARGRQGDLP